MIKSLSIIFPLFNEEKRLPNLFKKIKSVREYSVVRLFSERCVNQKSVVGIGCGGRI